MKNLCILLLLFSSLIVHSQNWEIAVPGERYFFRHIPLTSAQQFKGIGGFQLDSVLLQQNQINHHQLSKNLVPDPNSNMFCLMLESTLFGSELLINGQNQVIITSSNDSLVFPRYFKPNPAHHIIYNDSNGEKLRASFIKYDTIRFRGQLDSVVYVRIRHLDSLNRFILNGYLDTLILSKSNGLLRSLSWNDFPQKYGTRWLRREGGTYTKGEIFDYQPGDEFHIRKRNIYPSGPPTFINYKILARIDSGLPNSIKYVREYRRESATVNYNVNPPQLIKHYTFYIDTISYTNLDELYGGIPDQIEPNSNYYTFQMGGRNSYGIPAYLVHGPPTDTNNCWGYPNAVHGTLEQEIIKGIGILYYSNANGQGHPSSIEYLAYYKKGNKTWGTPRIITGIDDNPKDSDFELFPNPSSGIIHLKGNKIEAIKSISVYGIDGQFVKQIPVANRNTQDLSELSNGMYILHFEGEKLNEIQKLLIQKD